MPAPANDNFANAQALTTTLPASLTGLTTHDATFEGTEVKIFSSYDQQSIWFTFTPTTTGIYRFSIPYSSMAYNGVAPYTQDDGELWIGISAASTLATYTEANLLDSDSGYTDTVWVDKHNPGVSATLTSGTTYYIRIWSSNYGTQNRATVDFSLNWELLVAPGNDAFANRTTISGASGSQTFNLEAATNEASEPVPFYWWAGATANLVTVWYEWTAPSSGWFKFAVEHTEDAFRESPDLAVYTGTAIGSLTAVVKNEGGAPAPSISPRGLATVVAFQATSGTSYKIQIGGAIGYTNPYSGVGSLTWATMSAPTGDTGATALNGGFAETRIDNYGNSDNDAPPNAVTRLSAHPDWWFTTGAVGRSKWWKVTVPVDATVHITARAYANANGYSDYGLLAYKGASFGSIASTTDTQGDDAVLIGFGPNYAKTIGLGALPFREYLDVACTAGETLWLCMVGMYDTSYAGAAADSCPQTSLDLAFALSVLPNDNRTALNSSPLAYYYPWYLGRTEYAAYPASSWWTAAQAGHADGYTFSATAEGGEAAHAGYGPTRSVWYVLDIVRAGNYKIWVESDVDCVLGIYNKNNSPNLGSLVAEDDDSGTGNWPEVTVGLSASDYWIVVDSKTEGAFRLKWERIGTGTPPANNNFASATNIASTPYSSSGTTINATAEADEHDCWMLGSGPKDTVWYKFVASGNGTLKVKATCDSANGGPDSGQTAVGIDLWHGTTLQNLVRHPEPPSNKGFFNHFDTPAQLEQQALYLDYVNGETYYIRVQTPGGGSEDFTIYAEVMAVYIDLQVSGQDVGPFTDSATVNLDLSTSSVEDFHQVLILDSGTVVLDLQASGIDLKGFEYTDANSVYFNLQGFTEQDCYFHLEPSFIADGVRKWAASGVRRWGIEGSRRWAWTEGEGLPQVC